MLEFKLLATAYAETHTVNMERQLILNARVLALDKALKNVVLDGETLFTVLVTWVGNFFCFKIIKGIIEFSQCFKNADALTVSTFKNKVK